MASREKAKLTQNGYDYSEAEEVALMAWLDFALDLTSNGSKRLNPLLVRYGGLKRGIVTKALADGIILSMVMTGLCPTEVNFKKQNFNQRPKSPVDRLSNMKILFKTITSCFPDLPHFDMSAATHPTQKQASNNTSATAAAITDAGGYDGSINGRCTPSPEAVASGTDRNATLELIWRIFLGNALKVMKSNAIENETITDTKGSSDQPTYLKETYKVLKGDTVAGVALKHRMKTNELYRLNNGLRGTSLFPGQEITVFQVDKSGHRMEDNSPSPNHGIQATPTLGAILGEYLRIRMLDLGYSQGVAEDAVNRLKRKGVINLGDALSLVMNRPQQDIDDENELDGAPTSAASFSGRYGDSHAYSGERAALGAHVKICEAMTKLKMPDVLVKTDSSALFKQKVAYIFLVTLNACTPEDREEIQIEMSSPENTNRKTAPVVIKARQGDNKIGSQQQQAMSGTTVKAVGAQLLEAESEDDISPPPKLPRNGRPRSDSQDSTSSSGSSSSSTSSSSSSSSEEEAEEESNEATESELGRLLIEFSSSDKFSAVKNAVGGVTYARVALAGEAKLKNAGIPRVMAKKMIRQAANLAKVSKAMDEENHVKKQQLDKQKEAESKKREKELKSAEKLSRATAMDKTKTSVVNPPVSSKTASSSTNQNASSSSSPSLGQAKDQIETNTLEKDAATAAAAATSFDGLSQELQHGIGADSASLSAVSKNASSHGRTFSGNVVLRVLVNTLTDAETWGEGDSQSGRIWWPVRDFAFGESFSKKRHGDKSLQLKKSLSQDLTTKQVAGGKGDKEMLHNPNVSYDMPMSWIWSELLRALEESGEEVNEESGLEVIGLRREIDTRYLPMDKEVKEVVNGYSRELTLIADVVDHGMAATLAAAVASEEAAAFARSIPEFKYALEQIAEAEAEAEAEALDSALKLQHSKKGSEASPKRQNKSQKALNPSSALKATIAAANGEMVSASDSESGSEDSEDEDGDYAKKYRDKEFETSSSSSSTSAKTKTNSQTSSSATNNHPMRNPQLIIDQATLVAIEKYTFESWINVRLLGRGVFVTDLFTDLRSGVILAHLVECLSGRRIAGLNALDKQSPLPPSLAPPLPVTVQAKRAIMNASKAARRSVRRARAASLGSVLASDSLNSSRTSNKSLSGAGGGLSDSDSDGDDDFDNSMSSNRFKDLTMLSESGRKLTQQEKRELAQRQNLMKKKNKIEAAMARELERDQLKQGGKDFMREQGDSQMVCFRRMVTVFKFLRVVADAVETNHLDGVQKDQFRRIISSDMNEGSFFINETMDQNEDGEMDHGTGEETEGSEVGSMVWATPNRTGGNANRSRANSGASTSFSENQHHSVIFTHHTEGDAFDWGPITLSSISPISIVHGRPVETLQLMRTLLCVLATPMWMPDGYHGLSGLKRTLAAWANRHVKPYAKFFEEFKPFNLGSNFRDGLALLIILNSLNPAECPCPISSKALALNRKANIPIRPTKESDWMENWKSGVALANHIYGVPRLIDVTAHGFWANEVVLVTYMTELMMRASRYQHVLPLSEVKVFNQAKNGTTANASQDKLKSGEPVDEEETREKLELRIIDLEEEVAKLTMLTDDQEVELRDAQKREVEFWNLKEEMRVVLEEQADWESEREEWEKWAAFVEEQDPSLAAMSPSASSTGGKKHISHDVMHEALKCENEVLQERVSGLMKYHEHVHARQNGENSADRDLELSKLSLKVKDLEAANEKLTQSLKLANQNTRSAAVKALESSAQHAKSHAEKWSQDADVARGQSEDRKRAKKSSRLQTNDENDNEDNEEDEEEGGTPLSRNTPSPAYSVASSEDDSPNISLSRATGAAALASSKLAEARQEIYEKTMLNCELEEKIKEMELKMVSEQDEKVMEFKLEAEHAKQELKDMLASDNFLRTKNAHLLEEMKKLERDLNAMKKENEKLLVQKQASDQRRKLVEARQQQALHTVEKFSLTTEEATSSGEFNTSSPPSSPSRAALSVHFSPLKSPPNRLTQSLDSANANSGSSHVDQKPSYDDLVTRVSSLTLQNASLNAELDVLKLLVEEDNEIHDGTTSTSKETKRSGVSLFYQEEQKQGGEEEAGDTHSLQRRLAIRVKAAKASGAAEGKLLAMRQELNNKVVKRALRRLAKQRPLKNKPGFLHETSTTDDDNAAPSLLSLGESLSNDKKFGKLSPEGNPDEKLMSCFFASMKIGDEVEVRDFGDDWGKGLVQAFDEDGDEKIPKVMQQGYDEAYIWDEYRPLEGWHSFIRKLEIEEELDAEEDGIDAKAEAEEEEAIFQLALCSLWTSQEKFKDFHASRTNPSDDLGVFKKAEGRQFNGQEVITALSNERKRCRVLIAERDDATQSVARSEEAMQRLLKGASSMRSFFTSKVRDLEMNKSNGSNNSSKIQTRHATPHKPSSNSVSSDGEGDGDLESKLLEAKQEIKEREEESEQLAQELEEMLTKLNACYATISKLEHCGFKVKNKASNGALYDEGNKNKIEEGNEGNEDDEEASGSRSSESGSKSSSGEEEEEEEEEEDLISAIDDLSVAMEEDTSRQGSTLASGNRGRGSNHNDEQIAELTAEMDRLRSELEASKAELKETKTEVTALSAASGVSLPERLHRQESYERTAAMLTLQAEADSAQKLPRDQASSTYYHSNNGVSTSQGIDFDSKTKTQLENDSDMAIANRTLELKSSIQEAIATTMAYLKGHLVQLRPNDKAFLNRAISSCAAGFELRLFREAHLTIKRAVLEVAGEQSRYVRRWLIPHGALTKISPHKQHELLKQIRLLVVAYDNMDEASKEKLTTAAEVLANLDVLIEVGQVCLAAEHARRSGAPRPLRPTQYGAHDVPIVIDGSLVPMSTSPTQQPSGHHTQINSNGSMSSSQPSSSGERSTHPSSHENGMNAVKYHYPPAQEIHVGNPRNSPYRTSSGSVVSQKKSLTMAAPNQLFRDDAAYNTPPKTRYAPPAAADQRQADQLPPSSTQQHVHESSPPLRDSRDTQSSTHSPYQTMATTASSNGSIEPPASEDLNQDNYYAKPKFKSTASKVQQKLEERELASLQRKQALRRRQAERGKPAPATSLLNPADRRTMEMLGDDLPSYLTFRSTDALLERQNKNKTNQAKPAKTKAVRYWNA